MSTRAAAGPSFLSGVEQAPADPILGVSVAFRESTNPNKLNLGVGAYRTEDLKPYVLDVVKRAERLMIEADYDKEYLPIDGLAEFRKGAQGVLFGFNSPLVGDARVASVQTLSGTGALRVIGEFLAKFRPVKPFWLRHLSQLLWT